MGGEKGQIKVVGGDKSLQGLTHPVKDNEKLQVILFFIEKWSFNLNRLEKLKLLVYQHHVIQLVMFVM